MQRTSLRLKPLLVQPHTDLITSKSLKDYDNETDFKFELDESAVVQYFVERQGLMADERETLMHVEDVNGLRKALNELGDPTQRQKALLETVNAIFEQGSAGDKTVKVRIERLPKIAYLQSRS